MSQPLHRAVRRLQPLRALVASSTRALESPSLLLSSSSRRLRSMRLGGRPAAIQRARSGVPAIAAANHTSVPPTPLSSSWPSTTTIKTPCLWSRCRTAMTAGETTAFDDASQEDAAASTTTQASPLTPDDPAAPGVPFPALCARLDERISSFLEQDAPDARLMAVQEQTKVALAVIDEALQRYSLHELSLSYNGGKDCLVLLILYLAALHRRGLAHTTSALQSVYIQSSHPFAEVEHFVAHSVRTYSLALATYAAPMKEAFALYLRDTPAVKAIFVGTRRTDPHGERLTHFDPTDHGWPSFMRIHPVIDWHYVEIWTFIRHLSIPYCPLYDQGYTSLGGTTDTHPNPALRVEPPQPNGGNGNPSPAYRPAYELVEDYEERLGRDGKGGPAAAASR